LYIHGFQHAKYNDTLDTFLEIIPGLTSCLCRLKLKMDTALNEVVKCWKLAQLRILPISVEKMKTSNENQKMQYSVLNHEKILQAWYYAFS
jgi:hypothetical protein